MHDGGVQFPLIDGDRSTQRTGRDVFAAAAAACDARLADAITAETAWRSAYPRHLRALTVRAAAAPADGVAIARAGLDQVHDAFVFVDDPGTRSLADAMAAPTGPALSTRTVAGEGVHAPLVVPYRGRTLQGDALLAAADDWRRRGIVEPAVVTALERLTEHPDWLDLRDTWFAVLGAGAEMAPTGTLLAWGADVVAVDMPQPQIWRRLEDLAAAGTGRLHVPVDDRGGPLGVDLTADAPRVLGWLATFEKPLVAGNYAYADGAQFARVSVAADAVLAGLRRQRDDHGVVCIATPTDAFAVPADVVEDARRRHDGVGAVVGRGVRTLSGNRLLVPNYRETVRTDDGRQVGIADSLVLQQGPNYALAKRIQRWRALTTHADDAFGAVQVAPPTRTRSVLKSRVLAAAYAGAAMFGVETFEPATSSALMAALLVHDLRTHHDHGSPVPLPEHELTAAAVHGGLWRVAWEPRTALPLAVVRGATAALHAPA